MSTKTEQQKTQQKEAILFFINDKKYMEMASRHPEPLASDIYKYLETQGYDQRF